MSRSRRKVPILSYCAPEGEHWFKHYAHRALRRAVRAGLDALLGGDTCEDHELAGDGRWYPIDTPVLPLLREVSNPWCWPKDGKQWCGWDEAKWLRK